MHKRINRMLAIILSIIMFISAVPSNCMFIPDNWKNWLHVDAAAAGIAGYNATAAAKWADAHVQDIEMNMFGNLVMSTTAPSCTVNGTAVRACTRSNCGYSEFAYSNPGNTISDWTTAYRSDIPIAQSMTQYRYRDYLTTTSTSTSLDGWSRTGAEWILSGTGSQNWADFPSGFSTSHSIYTSFSKGVPYAASETETNKRTVSNAWAGYVYWHWMYNCNGANAYDRAIYNQSGYCSVNGRTTAPKTGMWQ